MRWEVVVAVGQGASSGGEPGLHVVAIDYLVRKPAGQQLDHGHTQREQVRLNCHPAGRRRLRGEVEASATVVVGGASVRVETAGGAEVT